MCGGRWSGLVPELAPYLAPYLARKSDQIRKAWAKRFGPRLWTIDFARPMMASVVQPSHGTLRVDLEFHTSSDLAGLIWTSEDRWSHPLLSYATDRDYRGCVLSFEWHAGPGLMPLDQNHGPVMTIEGRDATGAPHTWYVRLWNYAEGTPGAASVVLDFDDLRDGFALGGSPIFTGDIDRLFISLVPVGYDESAMPLSSKVTTWLELRNMEARGLTSTLAIGDAFLPEHRLRICSGYDDSYHQAPERLVEQWLALGYRGKVNHYVGMSHYYEVAHAAGRFEVSGGLCEPAKAWHRALLKAARLAGMEIILSLSFELFDDNAPDHWAQKDHLGARALTGWEPPSTLLSPCSVSAMDWLKGIAADFAALAAAESSRLLFQVGEPWWWLGAAGRPCFYDAATVSAWTAEKGSAPPVMTDVIGQRSALERAYLDWLGERLSAATSGVREAARAAAPGVPFTSHLLFFAPQVLDIRAPDLRRANMPVGWASPEWDVLQLEDYDFVVSDDEWGMARGRSAVTAALGYPVSAQHYLAGFVLNPEDAALAWPKVADAAREAFGRGVAETFTWAWPQIQRDGFVWQEGDPAQTEGEAVVPFHDIHFPLELGFEAVGGPEFATQVAELTSGHEQRNIQWSQARLSYDAGLGVRSEADLGALLHFFRARRGRAFAFRFRDPIDFSSAADGGALAAGDQLLGVGDGLRLTFRLRKQYGEDGVGETRFITRPLEESVRVSVDGTERTSGWVLLEKGAVRFEEAPALGAEVRAGFEFDVPVRFAADRLDVSLSGFRMGEVPSVPLVEVRE